MSEIVETVPFDAEQIGELREKYYNATIVHRVDTHRDLARFRIRPDKPFPPFEPGQFVSLGIGNWEQRVAGTQDEELTRKAWAKCIQRAYSISCPMTSESADRDLVEVITVNDIDYLEFYVTLVTNCHTHFPGTHHNCTTFLRRRLSETTDDGFLRRRIVWCLSISILLGEHPDYES